VSACVALSNSWLQLLITFPSLHNDEVLASPAQVLAQYFEHYLAEHAFS